MTIVYKLTDENMKSLNGCHWTLGEWKETSGIRPLCGSGWLHCYRDPLLAVLLNPIHADFKTPRLFEAEAEGAELHNGFLKSGYSRMRLVKEIPLPEITTNQRVAFCILCAKKVYSDHDWNRWADNWLSGADRSVASAEAAADAAWSAWSAWSAESEADAAKAAADAAGEDLNLIEIAHEAIKIMEETK